MRPPTWIGFAPRTSIAILSCPSDRVRHPLVLALHATISVDATHHHHTWPRHRLSPPHDGSGLFADGPLAQGTVVARILAPLWLPTRGAIAFAARGHLPEDSFVRSELGRACVDLAWVLPLQPPPWYFLNHAHGSVANLNMRVVQTSTQHGVLWYANRDISAGTELRYNYGSVPSAWNVDAVGLGQQDYLEISAHNVQIQPRARKRRLLT